MKKKISLRRDYCLSKQKCILKPFRCLAMGLGWPGGKEAFLTHALALRGGEPPLTQKQLDGMTASLSERLAELRLAVRIRCSFLGFLAKLLPKWH